MLRDGCLEASFVFEVYGPFYTCGSVAMALISFWLHLVFLVSSYFSWFSCSTCSFVTHVVSETLGSWR